MSNTTATKVLRVIEHQMGMSKDSVKLSDNFIDDIGCDSLDSVELVMAMEEEFGIEIDEAECISSNFTVKDAITLIDSIIV